MWWGNQSTTLSLGMSTQQVRTMLGPPQDITTQRLEGMMLETWRYLDRTLTFHNGLLHSWQLHRDQEPGLEQTTP